MISDTTLLHFIKLIAGHATLLFKPLQLLNFTSAYLILFETFYTA